MLCHSLQHSVSWSAVVHYRSTHNILNAHNMMYVCLLNKICGTISNDLWLSQVQEPSADVEIGVCLCICWQKKYPKMDWSLHLSWVEPVLSVLLVLSLKYFTLPSMLFTHTHTAYILITNFLREKILDKKVFSCNSPDKPKFKILYHMVIDDYNNLTEVTITPSHLLTLIVSILHNWYLLSIL